MLTLHLWILAMRIKDSNSSLNARSPGVTGIVYIEKFRRRSGHWLAKIWNSFLGLGMMKFLSLTYVLDAGGTLHVGSVFFPLWWWEAQASFCHILSLPISDASPVLVQCPISSYEKLGNGFSGHNSSIISCISEQNRSITTCPKLGSSWWRKWWRREWWMGIATGITTNNTYQHRIYYITNIFSINSSLN